MFRKKITKSISVFISAFFIFNTAFSSPAAAQVFLPSIPIYSTPITIPIVFIPYPKSSYVYNAADQLTSLENKLTPAGTLISKHSYTYDRAGNRTSHTNQAASTSTVLNFTYNKVYELTGVTGAQTHAYQYDKVGNRIAVDGIAYTTNTLNQYTNAGVDTFTFDKNGNLNRCQTPLTPISQHYFYSIFIFFSYNVVK